MTIRIYRDNAAHSVVVSPSTVENHFTNSLHAVATDEGKIDIYDMHGLADYKEISGLSHTDVLKADGTAVGGSLTNVIDYLNSQFEPLSNVPIGIPVITSPLVSSVVSGTPYLYQIVATNDPFFYGATNLPVGLVLNPISGIIFGSTTVVGGPVAVALYAINAAGSGTDILQLTVLPAGPGFVDTFSIHFRGVLYKEHLAVQSSPAVERTSAQAWSICQFAYLDALGNYDLWSQGTQQNYSRIRLGNTGKVIVRFQNANNHALEVQAGMLTAGGWHHIAVVNTGANVPAAISIYIDGVLQAPTTASDTITGAAGGSGDFRVCRASGALSQALFFDGFLDHWAYYDKALSGLEVTAIYNGGVAGDLSLLASAANLKCWLRMGDGDTFPTLNDNAAGGLHPATMINMTAGSLVSFVPA